MTPDTELFDPQFLDRLRGLFFKLRKRKVLQKRGEHATPAAGFTREFKDHRRYTPGDDYRSIDWRLYARLEKPFIRIFEEVQEFHVHIVIDRSRSMIEPFSEKRVVQLRLAVALAYMALLNQHRVSILSLGSGLARETQPLKGPGHIGRVIERMSGLEFAGTTDISESLSHFRPSRDRRGLVFLISDLLGPAPETATEALLQATRWPAETHVIQVLHPGEADPNLLGEVRLVDVETGQRRRVWLARRDLERYRESFDRFVEDIRSFCMKRQIDYFRWMTDQPFEDAFLELLSRGSALAGVG